MGHGGGEPGIHGYGPCTGGNAVVDFWFLYLGFRLINIAGALRGREKTIYWYPYI
jgi:hypothetical protein